METSLVFFLIGAFFASLFVGLFLRGVHRQTRGTVAWDDELKQYTYSPNEKDA